jgi:hypothetical protein
MPDDGKTFYIQFPGNIMLEVHLQNPHPVNLTVRFSDNSGVIVIHRTLRERTRARQRCLALQNLKAGPLPPQKLKTVLPVSTRGCGRQLLRQPAQLQVPGAMCSSSTTTLVVHGCERRARAEGGVRVACVLPRIDCGVCRISTVTPAWDALSVAFPTSRNVALLMSVSTLPALMCTPNFPATPIATKLAPKNPKPRSHLLAWIIH